LLLRKIDIENRLKKFSNLSFQEKKNEVEKQIGLVVEYLKNKVFDLRITVENEDTCYKIIYNIPGEEPVSLLIDFEGNVKDNDSNVLFDTTWDFIRKNINYYLNRDI